MTSIDEMGRARIDWRKVGVTAKTRGETKEFRIYKAMANFRLRWRFPWLCLMSCTTQMLPSMYRRRLQSALLQLNSYRFGLILPT